MISRWTAHLKTEEEKKKFESNIIGARPTLDRLHEICTEMENDEEIDTVDYDSPNWAYRQADNIGFRRCLSKIKKLTDPDQHKK